MRDVITPFEVKAIRDGEELRRKREHRKELIKHINFVLEMGVTSYSCITHHEGVGAWIDDYPDVVECVLDEYSEYWNVTITRSIVPQLVPSLMPNKVERITFQFDPK